MKKQNLLTKKLPAFTLMEVTVAMLIAGIAIGITYTAFHIISVTCNNYQKKQDGVASFAILDKLLKQDFDLPGKIEKTGNGLQMQTAAGIVRYEFADNYITREQYALGIDTFKVKPIEVSCFFENNQVAAGQIIDQIQFKIMLEREPINLIYHKTYSAQDLIN